MTRSRAVWMIAGFCAGAALLSVGAGGAFAGGDGHDFAGTYQATLPERAEIMNLHRDGTASMTLSDQVTFGAGGFTFSDSRGSWRVVGPGRLSLRMLNLNFDLTGPAPAYSGMAVVDYDIQFAPGKDTFTASCEGKIFATGDDPLAPGAVPITTFDCAYLDGYLYRRATAP
ncbi:MAG: hypothetical protein R3F14_06240 [Polyangiaceae bacterium]